MYCNKCGNKINDGEHFCNKCGNSISITVSPENKNFQARLNKDIWKAAVIFLGTILIILILIYILIFNSGNMDDSTFLILIMLVIMGPVILMCVLLMKGTFKTKNQDSHYKVIINSRFNDDLLLEQKLVELLQSLRFYNASNYGENVFKQDLFDKGTATSRVLTAGSAENYISYVVVNGKIHLEAWIRQYGKEIAPDRGFYNVVFKKQFMAEIDQIIKYFDF